MENNMIDAYLAVGLLIAILGAVFGIPLALLERRKKKQNGVV